MAWRREGGMEGGREGGGGGRGEGGGREGGMEGVKLISREEEGGGFFGKQCEMHFRPC